jgi:hypothetical protein
VQRLVDLADTARFFSIAVTMRSVASGHGSFSSRSDTSKNRSGGLI